VVDRFKPKKSKKFHFIFLFDRDDDARIEKRMRVLEKLYRNRNLPVETIPLKGKNRFNKMFSSLLLADWTAYHLGSSYGVETEEVPMVEEFKRLIKN